MVEYTAREYLYASGLKIIFVYLRVDILYKVCSLIIRVIDADS